MKELDITTKNCQDTAHSFVVREYGIGGKKYVVKSIFIGDKDIKSTLLNLAEKKAIKEMGPDYAIT